MTGKGTTSSRNSVGDRSIEDDVGQAEEEICLGDYCIEKGNRLPSYQEGTTIC